MASLLSHLQCPRCGDRTEADKPHTVCQRCQGPMYAQYDLASANLGRGAFGARGPTMWRYQELLPVRDERNIVTLGEGSTPLLHAAHLGKELGMTGLLIKDEGRNPTGTFKARGMSACVSKNRELGISKFAVPTAGNAGGALAAYAAAGGCKAFIACPDDTPLAARIEVHVTGATLRRVPGSIADAARFLQNEILKDGWFDVSTMREPYRLEGKKTMGFEIAEALNWSLPDVIIYPTGGGTGLVGIWKAFLELEALGFVTARRPRMVAVQASGCAPVVKAFASGHDTCQAWEKPTTVASGLRVPKPFADREVLAVLRDSKGTAVAVDDDAILEAGWELARTEGVFACPEGAAAVAGLKYLRSEGWIDAKESVVVLNTGSGTKYIDAYMHEPKGHSHEPYDQTDH